MPRPILAATLRRGANNERIKTLVPQDTLTTFLSIWGATVASGLAGLRVWEVWQERARLSVTCSFSSDPRTGHEIIIQNPSTTPFMISYWELLWVTREFCRRKTVYGMFPNEGYCDITVGGHSRHILRFQGAEYFPWRTEDAIRGKIYLKLYIVGRRRPLWLYVNEFK